MLNYLQFKRSLSFNSSFLAVKGQHSLVSYDFDQRYHFEPKITDKEGKKIPILCCFLMMHHVVEKIQLS